MYGVYNLHHSLYLPFILGYALNQLHQSSHFVNLVPRRNALCMYKYLIDQ